MVVDVPRGTKVSDLEDGGILQWDTDGLGAKLVVRGDDSRDGGSSGHLSGRIERILGSVAVVERISEEKNTESAVVEGDTGNVEVGECK